MPSIHRFARILIAKPVPTFAEYAQFIGVRRPTAIIKTAYSPPTSWPAAVPPADNADLPKSTANSLVCPIFSLK
jgi:hypothetical protein